MKELILHVGFPKTATTSLQYTLSDEANQKLLSDKGFTYLCLPEYEPQMLQRNVCTLIANHFYCDYMDLDMFWGVRFRKIPLYPLRGEIALKDFKSLADKTVAETAIISAENITPLNLEGIYAVKKLILETFGDVSIRTVLTVREPIAFAVSALQQVLRRGCLTYEEAYAKYKEWMPTVYSETIGKLWKVFGRENVLICEFEALFDEGINPVKKFLTLIGYTVEETNNFKIYKRNESSSFEAIELRSYINANLCGTFKALEPSQEMEKLFELDNNTYCIGSIRGSKFDIAYQQKQELYELSRGDVKWLKDNTGVDYTNMAAPNNNSEERYGKETITELAHMFPSLNYEVQKLFLKFFKDKYFETKDEKFKKLFDENSEPFNMFLLIEEITRNDPDNKLITQNSNVDYAQIILNPFQEFKPENCYTIRSEALSLIRMDTNIAESTANPSIHDFSIVPSLFPCVCYLKTVKINGKDNNYENMEGSFDYVSGKIYVFLKNYIRLNFHCKEAINTISVEFYIKKANPVFSYFTEKVLEEKTNMEYERLLTHYSIAKFGSGKKYSLKSKFISLLKYIKNLLVN